MTTDKKNNESLRLVQLWISMTLSVIAIGSVIWNASYYAHEVNVLKVRITNVELRVDLMQNAFTQIKTDIGVVVERTGNIKDMLERHMSAKP